MAQELQTDFFGRKAKAQHLLYSFTPKPFPGSTWVFINSYCLHLKLPLFSKAMLVLQLEKRC